MMVKMLKFSVHPTVHLPGLFVAGLCFLALLLGCQGATIGGKGDLLKQQSRIAVVVGGEQSGQFQTDDLTVDYSYSANNAGSLQISGKVRFSGSIQENFNLINYFNLGLILADAAGTVLSEQDLTSAGPINLTDENQSTISFKNTLKLPAGTAMMGFKYTGQAQGDGTRDTTEFFSDPVVR